MTQVVCDMSMAPTTRYPAVFTFVPDGVISAIDLARAAAGEGDVSLHGATVMQQALPLGLVDEIRVHVVPVLLGAGTPLFGTLPSAVSLERLAVQATPGATHLAFRVVHWAALRKQFRSERLKWSVSPGK